MSLLRAFVAIEIPPQLQDEIQKATTDLQKKLGTDVIRWVALRNVHLTLKFLGDVSPANVDMIEQMLTREASQHQPFDMQVEGLGTFPNPRRPRVLWVGLVAPPALASLQRGIETAASRLGYTAEERDFSAHLTIGRVRQNASATDLLKIRTALEQTRIGQLGNVFVDAIYLFKSDLQPTGSIYTKLFTAPLRE